MNQTAGNMQIRRCVVLYKQKKRWPSVWNDWLYEAGAPLKLIACKCARAPMGKTNNKTRVSTSTRGHIKHRHIHRHWLTRAQINQKLYSFQLRCICKSSFSPFSEYAQLTIAVVFGAPPGFERDLRHSFDRSRQRRMNNGRATQKRISEWK